MPRRARLPFTHATDVGDLFRDLKRNSAQMMIGLLERVDDLLHSLLSSHIRLNLLRIVHVGLSANLELGDNYLR